MISPSDRNPPEPDPAPLSERRDRSWPGLSRHEEHRLAARVAAGDRAARDRLIETHLGLVVTIARRYLGRRLELDDLIGEGNLGLIRAAEGFDPRIGARFSTFAACFIRRAICAALTHRSSTIRLPESMVSLLLKWRRAERALGGELGRAPSFDETASSLGLTKVRRVLVSRALDAGRLRLESSYGSGLRDGLSGVVMDRHDGPEEGVDAQDERAVAWRLIGQLDGRERDILMLRFGLEGEGLTLAEIGRRLGLTRERVRQIEGRALDKIGQRQPEDGDRPRASAHREESGEPGSGLRFASRRHSESASTRCLAAEPESREGEITPRGNSEGRGAPSSRRIDQDGHLPRSSRAGPTGLLVRRRRDPARHIPGSEPRARPLRQDATDPADRVAPWIKRHS